MECPICYEIIGKKNQCVTACGHSFCTKCLLSAYNRNGTCPCCRAVLNEDNDLNNKKNSDDEEDLDSEISDEDCVDLEVVVKEFEEKGYTLKDAMAMLINHTSKIGKVITRDDIKKIDADLDEIMEKLYPEEEAEEAEEEKEEEEEDEERADPESTAAVFQRLFHRFGQAPLSYRR